MRPRSPTFRPRRLRRWVRSRPRHLLLRPGLSRRRLHRSRRLSPSPRSLLSLRRRRATRRHSLPRRLLTSTAIAAAAKCCSSTRSGTRPSPSPSRSTRSRWSSGASAATSRCSSRRTTRCSPRRTRSSSMPDRGGRYNLDQPGARLRLARLEQPRARARLPLLVALEPRRCAGPFFGPSLLLGSTTNAYGRHDHRRAGLLGRCARRGRAGRAPRRLHHGRRRRRGLRPHGRRQRAVPALPLQMGWSLLDAFRRSATTCRRAPSRSSTTRSSRRTSSCSSCSCRGRSTRGASRSVPGAPLRATPWPASRRSSRACSCTRASRTSAATCSSSGSSATTSRTRWGTSATSLLPRGRRVRGGGADAAIDPLSMVPMLGASGAISAVLAAYVFLYPRSPDHRASTRSSSCGSSSASFSSSRRGSSSALFFVVNLWDALHDRARRAASRSWRTSAASSAAPCSTALFLIGRDRASTTTTRHDRLGRSAEARAQRRLVDAVTRRGDRCAPCRSRRAPTSPPRARPRSSSRSALPSCARRPSACRAAARPRRA